ncbi:lasso peptide isopeptide bond-forming cyclase [Paenibacillus eucommiae]|uniref:asparagine synthase (glutamine-hydrolyzing) n=1 Tax=Paenibacillus eucommiae TaxID=1355755 RepID=A0ABS4IU47_9BACL|nr:lasso peptide isopeptide bond-forming cyclase [Paenibacillus eucommiae]MBP1990386.1 asparagine synthase (glutamine-hydrolyzing) [Paenibacillus eucommiae]
MSAIAGIYHFDQEPVHTEHCHSMMVELEKYPADLVHTWKSDKVFLGCHAQYITQESIYECLPYYDSESQMVITADAIIDNRQELFNLLQVEHSRRELMTDSKLILLAYTKWGVEAPKYLVGDFAFMIWDERTQQLFGARDFSGGRTLYFFRNHERFAFCTVIQPLLSLPYVKRRLNEQWLAEYLAISSMVDAVDTSSTVYLGIEQLPPSHSILIHGDKVILRRYSTITPGEPLKLKSNEEYVEAFQEVFQQAVTSRLRTNRQVGSHLSGGLDSGSVVSFAAKALRAENKKLHTYSYVPAKDFKDYTPKNLMTNESPFIQSTVKHVGGITDHYLDLEGKDSYSEVDDFLDMMEMPYKFFENSSWLKGIFEKAREQNVGVILSGARGNMTISWGTAMNYYAVLLKKMKWVRLAYELNHYSRVVGGNRLRRLPLIARVAFPFMERLFSIGSPNHFPVLINPEFARRTNVYNKLKEYGMGQAGWYSSRNMYELRRKHFDDLFNWNTTNTFATKLSLRYSLWTRDPTNDIRLIRFCLSVPEEQYVQNGVGRSLVRRSTENLLPDNVRLNHRIFGVQGADWLHRIIPHWGSITEELQQLCTDKRALEFLDGERIQRALTMAREGVRPEFADNPDYRALIRSLIVYRFIKKMA